MRSSTSVLVKKANGERELFIPEKLFQSLIRSGANPDVADTITAQIASGLQAGDRTADIYSRAFAELRRIERPMAARYSVKHALLELGPAGYSFEDYLAEIYRVQGYLTTTRVTVQGRCVSHELDLVAVRDDQRIGAEVKFHNNSGLKSDIKVALYVQARFEDIAAGVRPETTNDYTTRMVITNTKFTEQAEMYAACVGLSLLSWDYPEKGSLRELIEETRIHPITCVTSLSTAHKKRLMEQGVVLCRQVREHTQELEGLGLQHRAIERVLAETDALCPNPF
jgi:Restriction endonuclease